MAWNVGMDFVHLRPYFIGDSIPFLNIDSATATDLDLD